MTEASSPGTETGLAGWRKAIQWAQLRHLESEVVAAEKEMALDMTAVNTGRFGVITERQVAALPSVQRVAEVASRRVRARWKFAISAVVHKLKTHGPEAFADPVEDAPRSATPET